MSMSNSPSVVTNGLAFYYDMYNPSSYAGPPLTNLLPNGINAGYPTSPTGWGTYNTNQYGSGTYFSIGTITGVASNIITCPNHPLRTYDVVQPQSSGGGLTGGTNYLVRKWDANTFSLYSYDSTQDSTNIFQTQVNLNTDNRVAVSSGVSNMWWGYPHLPNSGIMKQTITNGFNWQGRVHDCLRVHWYRADGVCDGMAYGNEASITANTTYTVSFWARAATPNAVGCYVYCEQYVNGFDTGTYFVLTKNWQNYRIQFTPTQSGGLNLYWFNNNLPAQSAWDIAEIMVYAGTSPSKGYISSGSTRSSTQTVLDLTKQNTVTVNNLTYNSDGTFSFNGSNSDIRTPLFTNARTSVTMTGWFYVNLGTTGTFLSNGDDPGGYCIGIGQYFSTTDNQVCALFGYIRWILTGVYYQYNGWHMITMTFDSSGTPSIYINGALIGTYPGTIANTPSAGTGFSVGSQWGIRYANTQSGSVGFYNRELTASEVAQNFNALRGKYGV